MPGMRLRMRSRPDGEQCTERQREQSAAADDQHRLAQHIGDHAPAREAERAQRRDLAETLIDRHGQQHGDQQHRKRERDRRQHRRDLTEVGEAALLEAIHRLRVAQHAAAREAASRRPHRDRRARGFLRRHHDHVRLIGLVAAARRREPVERGRKRVPVRRIEWKLRDTDHRESNWRKRLLVVRTRRS